MYVVKVYVVKVYVVKACVVKVYVVTYMLLLLKLVGKVLAKPPQYLKIRTPSGASVEAGEVSP